MALIGYAPSLQYGQTGTATTVDWYSWDTISTTTVHQQRPYISCIPSDKHLYLDVKFNQYSTTFSDYGNQSTFDNTKFYSTGYGYPTHTYGRHFTTAASYIDYASLARIRAYGVDADFAKSPGERLRQIIQSRLGPQIITKKLPERVTDLREKRARQTLRRIVGEDSFRRYMTRGFIMVKGQKTGYDYQIFPGHGITAVWVDGKVIDRLCVVLSGGNFCPTDSVVMRYVMITADEDEFIKRAYHHSVVQSSRSSIVVPNQRPLLDIVRDLRKGIHVSETQRLLV